MLKRLIDLIIAVALLPVVVPLCVLLVIAIRFETQGAPVFVQQRLGRRKKVFRMFKLRTMKLGTGDVPSQLVGHDRITRVGAYLRRLKLDELPQVLNVLEGSMTFVGPRPCLPSQSELIGERDRNGIFEHLPGVTGPAQLAGVDMSDPALLARVEAEYFNGSTAWTDLRLMLVTALGGGKGDAALKERLPEEVPGNSRRRAPHGKAEL